VPYSILAEGKGGERRQEGLTEQESSLTGNCTPTNL